MKTLKIIQDEVARESHGKYSEDAGWSDFTEEVQFKLWPEVCRRAQLECARETLIEASEKATTELLIPIEDGCRDFKNSYYVVNKSSINNEDNIKLVE